MIKRLSVGVIAVLFILLIIASFASAITGAMGNAKMVLYPEVNGFTYTKIEKSILTKNVNDVPINISLQVDNETAKFIELIDETFILEPHTEKTTTEDIVTDQDSGKKSPALTLGLLIGSVFVLLLILVALIIALSKKSVKRRKVNGRRKK